MAPKVGFSELDVRNLFIVLDNTKKRLFLATSWWMPTLNGLLRLRQKGALTCSQALSFRRSPYGASLLFLSRHLWNHLGCSIRAPISSPAQAASTFNYKVRIIFFLIFFFDKLQAIVLKEVYIKVCALKYIS